MVTATGWGTEWFGGPIATILQKVDLTVITNAACAKSYNNSAVIIPSQLCTTAMGHDACQVRTKASECIFAEIIQTFICLVNSGTLAVHCGIVDRPTNDCLTLA